MGDRCAAFPRSARLLAAADYRRVFATPQRSSDRFFTCLACPGTTAEARLGLAVARKCARRAVARNRLKRLIREVFRGYRADLLRAGCNLDIVVLCRPPAVAADNSTLRRSLNRHLDHLRGRLCAGSSA